MNKSNIIYPAKPSIGNLVIGVTAPSSGLGTTVFNNRIDLVIKEHQERGVKIIEGKCLRDQNNSASAAPVERAEDLNQMFANDEINFIQPPWGGEKLIEILEMIDFESIKKKPKWIQGYSDISTLLFSITLKTGVATAHGTNFIDSIEGQDSLTSNSRSYIELDQNESFKQDSSEKWQQQFTDFADQLDSKYNLTETTEWKVLDQKESVLKMRGRLIGGCIDTIRNLIGTPYGNLPKFCQEYAQDEGIILYLENCNLDPMQFLRSLYNMKYANWFANINGVIIGRSNGPDEEVYLGVIESFFSSFDFPVVYDADIGHRPPQMTLINGAIAELEVTNGKAHLTQIFS